ncbi:MAG: hypothetical protein R3211_06955 [Balneolaceae bacterium]|nr:hypothetical protein [Balneolaceae bacterium]
MRRFTAILLILVFIASSGVFAQESESAENQIFFVQWLKPHNDKIQAFEKAVKEHNQKFHTEDGVAVFNEVTGKYHGHYEFAVGPYTWTEWENRDFSEAHDNHWISEVMPLVQHAAEPAAWKLLPKYQMNPMEKIAPKSLITVLTIKPGEYPRFMRALEEWHKANKAAEDFDGSYSVYARQYSGESQVAIISNLENGWSELDEDNNFRNRFEDKHGKMAWDLWLDDVVDAIKSEDVVSRILRRDLSTGLDN